MALRDIYWYQPIKLGGMFCLLLSNVFILYLQYYPHTHADQYSAEDSKEPLADIKYVYFVSLQLSSLVLFPVNSSHLGLLQFLAWFQFSWTPGFGSPPFLRYRLETLFKQNAMTIAGFSHLLPSLRDHCPVLPVV